MGNEEVKWKRTSDEEEKRRQEIRDEEQEVRIKPRGDREIMQLCLF